MTHRSFKVTPRSIAPPAAALGLASIGFAAVPPNATIPIEFTGRWAERAEHCNAEASQPIFTLVASGFQGLPGEKAYPQVKKLDRAGRHIRVSFYNSNGPLFWRSVEYFRLSSDGNELEYRFADREVNWVRCAQPTAGQKTTTPIQPNGAE